MQLEAQVGQAADHLASRNAATNPTDAPNQPNTIVNIEKNVAVILSKLEDFSKTQGAPNNHFNIHNNSVCHRDVSSSTVSHCKNCEKTISPEKTPGNHVTNVHGTPPTAETQVQTASYGCEQCGLIFTQEGDLVMHVAHGDFL